MAAAPAGAAAAARRPRERRRCRGRRLVRFHLDGRRQRPFDGGIGRRRRRKWERRSDWLRGKNIQALRGFRNRNGRQPRTGVDQVRRLRNKEGPTDVALANDAAHSGMQSLKSDSINKGRYAGAEEPRLNRRDGLQSLGANFLTKSKSRRRSPRRPRRTPSSTSRGRRC